MILVDTDGLLRGLVHTEPGHNRVKAFLEGSDDALIMSPFVLAELNYLLRKHLGQEAAIALLTDIEEGAYEYISADLADVIEARKVISSHSALPISLADASLVVLARKLQCWNVLTTDVHFRSLQPSGEKSYFTLVPEDLPL